MILFDPADSPTLDDNLTTYKRSFILSPEQWETIANLYEDYEWNEVKFEEESLDLISESTGLYIFTLSPKKVNADFINYFIYVGETNNLKRRFREYLRKLNKPKSPQYKMHRYINKYPNHLYFRYVEFPNFTQEQRREIEDQFLWAFTPPVNSKYPQHVQSIVLAVYGN